MSLGKINYMFNSHPMNDEQQALSNDIRAQIKSVAAFIDGALPECREKSIALTKLESALFYCNAGIARNK